MGTNFPTAIDDFTNPDAGDKLNSPLHTEQHGNANDAIEAIETFIGVNGNGIHNRTEKTTLADADEIGWIDSAAEYILKRLSFLNLKLKITDWNNPIGTIREFDVSTNPATLLGIGTWVAKGTGRVTVAIDAGQTEFDTLAETGGAKTHTLTEAELAAHGHVPAANVVGGSTGRLWTGVASGSAFNVYDTLTNKTANAGSGTAHNNLQPYIVVYRWVRTA